LMQNVTIEELTPLYIPFNGSSEEIKPSAYPGELDLSPSVRLSAPLFLL